MFSFEVGGAWVHTDNEECFFFVGGHVHVYIICANNQNHVHKRNFPLKLIFSKQHPRICTKTNIVAIKTTWGIKSILQGDITLFFFNIADT